MTSTTLFYIIIGILCFSFGLDLMLSILNAKRFSDALPENVSDIYDEEKYSTAQQYKKTNHTFGLIHGTFSFLLTLSFIGFGGFEYVDQFARNISTNVIVIALVFFSIIIIGSTILNIPFAYYSTFVIEEKFGFNKATKKIFFLDQIKNILMTFVLGGGIISLIIFTYTKTGTDFWLYAWGIVIVFMIFMNMFYARLIVPIFNKQTPLEEGSLKQKIADYAATVGFTLQKIYVLNASERSTKANAYFSGFGKAKRVTLYDTLINDLNEEEIVAVLAHEVGHYKRKHIIFNLILSLLLIGLTLFLFSLCLSYPELSQALGVSNPSFHVGLVAFMILYSPISEFTSLIKNYFSRKFEYQADNYAKATYDADAMINALKKITRNGLSNLTPHPAYVFMHYSHPTLIQRITNLKS